MTVACRLVATGKDPAELGRFVDRLRQDLMFLGYKPGRDPEIVQKGRNYQVIIGSIERKDGRA